MKRRMIFAAIAIIAVVIIVAVYLSQLLSTSEQLLPSSVDMIVDQDNDPEAIHSFGCGTLGLSLYQSFTPTISSLALVELRLAKGGKLPCCRS